MVLARLLYGQAPPEVIATHLGASLIALPKKGDRIRPIACGSVLRRLPARAVCTLLKDELRKAAKLAALEAENPSATVSDDEEEDGKAEEGEAEAEEEPEDPGQNFCRFGARGCSTTIQDSQDLQFPASVYA